MEIDDNGNDYNPSEPKRPLKARLLRYNGLIAFVSGQAISATVETATTDRVSN